MALLEFHNVGIAGIATCVPNNKINNYEHTQYFQAEDVRKVVDKIGYMNEGLQILILARRFFASRRLKGLLQI